MRNVPEGLYRNSLGAELHVIGYASDRIGIPIGYENLGGIYVAEARDDLFGTVVYLVTEASLKDCGYELVQETQARDGSNGGAS